MQLYPSIPPGVLESHVQHNASTINLVGTPTMRSRAQKMAKIIDGNTRAVARVQRFHILPLKNLYMVADQ